MNVRNERGVAYAYPGEENAQGGSELARPIQAANAAREYAPDDQSTLDLIGLRAMNYLVNKFERAGEGVIKYLKNEP